MDGNERRRIRDLAKRAAKGDPAAKAEFGELTGAELGQCIASEEGALQAKAEIVQLLASFLPHMRDDETTVADLQRGRSPLPEEGMLKQRIRAALERGELDEIDLLDLGVGLDPDGELVVRVE